MLLAERTKQVVRSAPKGREYGILKHMSRYTYAICQVIKIDILTYRVYFCHHILTNRYINVKIQLSWIEGRL